MMTTLFPAVSLFLFRSVMLHHPDFVPFFHLFVHLVDDSQREDQSDHPARRHSPWVCGTLAASRQSSDDAPVLVDSPDETVVR